MLTGYMEEDLQCKISEEGGYDKCPFIWERLAAANYLTAYSEDWPDMYAFGTSGFVRQPVDYYVRTLFNAAHDYGLPFPVNQFVRVSGTLELSKIVIVASDYFYIAVIHAMVYWTSNQ